MSHLPQAAKLRLVTQTRPAAKTKTPAVPSTALNTAEGATLR